MDLVSYYTENTTEAIVNGQSKGQIFLINKQKLSSRQNLGQTLIQNLKKADKQLANRFPLH